MWGRGCLACGLFLGLGSIQNLGCLGGGGGVEQAPCCHPHPASSCEPKEWLVCNYVWHSSHCYTVCSVVAQELVPTLDKLGA